MLQRRASIIKQVRAFFDGKDYLELDTPLLSPDLIPESCLEVFQTERIFPRGSRKESRSLWLIPSPEIHMKKIIAQYGVNVFQICKCFRNGESEGHLHNSEFTMLEYYTMNADYMDSLALTEELFLNLTRRPLAGNAEKQRTQREFLEEEFSQTSNRRFGRDAEKEKEKEKLPFERVTVAEAFEKWAGFDLFAVADEGADAMAKQARKLELDPMPGMSVPHLYDLIFIHAVEPNLKMERPVALIDYPAFVPCLAKKAANGKTAERWELYHNGIELANCFSEETDPLKVEEFFSNEESEKKRVSAVQHKVNQDYWKLFNGFPRCSGVAMGLDRLIMALTGKMTIDGVLLT